MRECWDADTRDKMDWQQDRENTGLYIHNRRGDSETQVKHIRAGQVIVHVGDMTGCRDLTETRQVLTK